MKFWLLLVASLLFSPLRAGSADRFDDPAIREIQRRHDLAVAGNKTETKNLAADLEKAVAAQPTDYLLKAYLGSVYTLRSRDAFPGPGKLKYLKDGLKLMDASVEAAPNEIPPRFIRAVNNYHLPTFCLRRDNARADFKILLEQISDPAIAATLSTDTKQAIYLFAGLSFKQLRDVDHARQTWQAGWDLAPSTNLAEKIQKQLLRLKN